jgi:hypothetical protein
MHAILLTALCLGGASGLEYAATDGEYCDECPAGRRHGCHSGCSGAFCRVMPQSCYNPSFGCYPSTRHMHRYPAFHNYSTRKAYNYRSYFDYPWHAGLHEPTSMFSYNVPGESALVEPMTPPIPAPEPAVRRPSPTPVRQAEHMAPVVRPQPRSVLR